MEDYSEGQKKKILLATSLMTPAHLYIWDNTIEKGTDLYNLYNTNIHEKNALEKSKNAVDNE